MLTVEAWCKACCALPSQPLLVQLSSLGSSGLWEVVAQNDLPQEGALAWRGSLRIVQKEYTLVTYILSFQRAPPLAAPHAHRYCTH